MFKVTYLGHQGWMFTSDGTTLLVDPVLVRDFGHDGVVGEVYPPREVFLERLPPISAVLLTHEHEDHFNIPTLHALDRSVPILLSDLSSRAAEKVLVEMGFRVDRVKAGEQVRLGPLLLAVLPVDHLASAPNDEWDVLPFLVQAVDRSGGFFSYVDSHPSEKLLRAAAKLTQVPILFCYTNSFTNFSFADAGLVFPERPIEERLPEIVGSLRDLVRRVWPELAGTLVCGGGYTFVGDRSELNRRAFPVDCERYARTLRPLDPDAFTCAPLPGDTIEMTAGVPRLLDVSAPFIEVRARATWPFHDATEQGVLLEDYSPATGSGQLSSDKERLLKAAVDDFAGHLFGSALFKGLNSLSVAQTAGRRRSLAIVFLCDDEPIVMAYDSRACGFEQVAVEDPAAEFVAGIECWGTDWLAAFHGEIAPSAILFGRCRSWSYAPRYIQVPAGEMWLYFGALRRPDSALALYRKLYSACAPMTRSVSHGKARIERVFGES